MPRTLFDKIWDAHEVADNLIYIDLHLVHEVTSPQAFDGLRLAGRKVRRPDRTLATADHNVPTDGTPVAERIRDELSRVQVQTLERNCEEFGVPIYSIGNARQGIVPVIGPVPEPQGDGDERALKYMGLQAGTPVREIKLDRVFIGSCTNSRIGDLRAAAEVVQGRKVASDVYAMVVPGSVQVKQQAEAEGLDEVFRRAGFDWRGAGCSMCLGMNPDILKPGERVASTSNRNFEGRQGRGGRTHLVSPEMAAAAAIEGRFVDIRSWDREEVTA